MPRRSVSFLNLALMGAIALVLLAAFLIALFPLPGGEGGYVPPPVDPNDPFVAAQRNSLVQILLGVTGTVSLFSLGALFYRRRQTYLPDWLETMSAESSWAMSGYDPTTAFVDPEVRVRKRLRLRARRRNRRTILILAGANVVLALAILTALLFFGPNRLDLLPSSDLPTDGRIRVAPIPLEVYLLTAATVALASIILTIGSSTISARLAAWRKRSRRVPPPPVRPPDPPVVRQYLDGSSGVAPEGKPIQIAAAPVGLGERLARSLPRERLAALGLSLLALGLLGALSGALYLRISSLPQAPLITPEPRVRPSPSIAPASPSASASASASLAPSRAPSASPKASASPSPSSQPTRAPSPTPSSTPAEARTAAARRAALPPCPGVENCGLYVTKRGDILIRIADDFGVTLAEILALNPGLVDRPNRIFSGETVRIPR